MIASDCNVNDRLRQKPARNQSMECCKMIAAILVVFLHVEFPGTFNGFVTCFSSFAVPVFFAITGYFNYGAKQETLTRRLNHNLQLYLVAILANLIYGILVTEYSGGSTIAYLRAYIPDLEEIVNLIVFHLDPRVGQLWYLYSACLCYVILRAYTRFFGEKPVNYRPLYAISMCLFSVFLALGVLAPVLGMEIPYPLYRNGYFLGLPMFSFGIFLHEYQEQILTNYRLTAKKQVLLIFIGVLLGIIQWKAIGMGEMPLGTILEIAALMIFLASHPKVTAHPGIGERLISKFGVWSTWIYLFHMIVLRFYSKFLQTSFTSALAETEPYLRPVLVAGLSFLAAVLFERGACLVKRLCAKK